jgi:predicted alpha/beta superfamily hydrolase
MKFLLVQIVIIPISLSSSGVAQQMEIVIGHSVQLQSEILGEQRRISVYTPPGYDRSNVSYPVLYLLDGDVHFQHGAATVEFLAGNGLIPQLIVVAISNTDRDRDFTPTSSHSRPGSGGAEKFLEFMRNELFTYIDDNYRTKPYRIIMGHSLGGMFAIYTLFNHPDMYGAYIAVSPYMMYNRELVLNNAKLKLAEIKELNKYLYIALGNEPDYTSTLGQFTQLLKSKKDISLIWDYEEFPTETHNSIPLKALYSGLEKLYHWWRLPQQVADENFDAVLDYYQSYSDRYGYIIEIPETMVNILGYRMLQQNRTQEAIRIFKYNVDEYPHSANVYDSLGEGYEADNQLDEARENYQKAVIRGQDMNDPNTAVYQTHLNAVEQKIELQ